MWNHPWDVKSWPAAGLWNKSQRVATWKGLVQRASHQVTYWNAIIACGVSETAPVTGAQRLNESRATHSPQPGMHEDTCSSKLVGLSALTLQQFSSCVSGWLRSKPTHSTVPEYSIAQDHLRAHSVSISCVFKLFYSGTSPWAWTSLYKNVFGIPYTHHSCQATWDTIDLCPCRNYLMTRFSSCHLTGWGKGMAGGLEGDWALDQGRKRKENLVSQGMMVGQGLVTDANNPESDD